MKLYKEEKLQRNIDQKAYQIEMSNEFKKNYKKLSRKMLYQKTDKSSNSNE